VDPKKFGRKQLPEEHIRAGLVKLLLERGWFVKITHGNEYSSGLPDLYCLHVNWGQRWIEVKHADSYHFTRAQLDTFPQMSVKGAGIWVVALPRNYTQSMLEYEYKNVVCDGPPNWTVYLGHSKRPY